MFRHILLPVDGSALAGRAVRKGVKFAKSTGAMVTFVFVALPYRLAVSRHVKVPATQRLMQARYEKEIKNYARAVLRKAQRVAASAGVMCSEVHASALSPCEGILKTARRSGCDLIAMASHGHGGVAALLLGSVTRSVLIQSKIPVLVYR
jgi:nucleotide-binding universal stress UspA family protein